MQENTDYNYQVGKRMKDSGYVLKNSDNLYFIGFNDISDQLRKANIYKSEKMANKYCNELNNKNFLKILNIKNDFKIVKVEIREVE